MAEQRLELAFSSIHQMLQIRVGADKITLPIGEALTLARNMRLCAIHCRESANLPVDEATLLGMERPDRVVGPGATRADSEERHG
jgi:hypothetical protein